MALPKIDLPTYEFELPSTGKMLKFRPFLVKEQKILLMALEAGKEIDIITAIKQIIKNCVIEDDFSVDDLAPFDLEYFFINLRARSIGEKIALSFKCKNIVDEKECNHLMEFEHDILTAKVQKTPDHDKTIFFSKNVGVVMKYPSLQLAQNLVNNNKNKKQNSIDEAFDLISQCVDYFFEGENIFYVKEMNKKEVVDYLENIPKQSFDKIEKFFETAPKVISTIEHQCAKCGFEHRIPMEGLVSFFD